MTVYVDDSRRLVATTHVSARCSRLFADCEAELRTFAVMLGLSRGRVFNPGTPYAYYLVRERIRRRAVEAGAVEISADELSEMINSRRKAGVRALHVIAEAIRRGTAAGGANVGQAWLDQADVIVDKGDTGVNEGVDPAVAR